MLAGNTQASPESDNGSYQKPPSIVLTFGRMVPSAGTLAPRAVLLPHYLFDTHPADNNLSWQPTGRAPPCIHNARAPNSGSSQAGA